MIVDTYTYSGEPALRIRKDPRTQELEHLGCNEPVDRPPMKIVNIDARTLIAACDHCGAKARIQRDATPGIFLAHALE